jgi:hypothetical protein
MCCAQFETPQRQRRRLARRTTRRRAWAHVGSTCRAINLEAAERHRRPRAASPATPRQGRAAEGRPWRWWRSAPRPQHGRAMSVGSLGRNALSRVFGHLDHQPVRPRRLDREPEVRRAPVVRVRRRAGVAAERVRRRLTRGDREPRVAARGLEHQRHGHRLDPPPELRRDARGRGRGRGERHAA